MDFIDNIEVQHILEAFDDVHILGCSLHEDLDAIAEDRDGSEHAQEGKQEGTNRVYNVPLWLEVNDDSCDDYSYGLDNVSYDVDDSCSDVHVFMAVSTMGMSM